MQTTKAKYREALVNELLTYTNYQCLVNQLFPILQACLFFRNKNRLIFQERSAEVVLGQSELEAFGATLARVSQFNIPASTIFSAWQYGSLIHCQENVYIYTSVTAT